MAENKTYELNPTNLSQMEFTVLKNGLKQLLKTPDIEQNEHKEFFIPQGTILNDGNHSYRINRPLLGTNSTKHPGTQRWFVLDSADPFQTGTHGKIHHSKGTLYPTRSIFFKKPSEKSAHVIKKINATSSTKENIQQEADNLQSSKVLKGKKPIFFNDHSFLIMQKKGTGDLFDFVRKNTSIIQCFTVTKNLIKSYIDQFASLNLIHRDIKSENITINKKAEIFFVDLATQQNILEKNLNESVDNKRIISGTPWFLAPELINNCLELNSYYISQNVITPALDVFALGLTISELWGNEAIHTIMDICNHNKSNDFEKIKEIKKFRDSQGLFIGLCGNMTLTKEQGDAIFHLIDAMTQTNPTDRISIYDAYKLVEDMAKFFPEEVVNMGLKM